MSLQVHWAPETLTSQLLQIASTAIDTVALPDDDVLLARLRLALHLPQFPVHDLANPQFVASQAAWVMEEIRTSQAEFRPSKPATPWELRNHQDALVMPVPDMAANAVHRVFHYIGSARQGRHFGLYPSAQAADTSLPDSLLTFSPLDIPLIVGMLPHGIAKQRVLVLSRVYSFRTAPRNAFSYTFARALRALREIDEAPEVIVTYVNANVGFSGVSYQAANWIEFVDEPLEHYEYLDHRYITPRTLVELFGTANHDRLRQTLGSRFDVSKIPLAPLKIFAYPISRESRVVFQS